MSSQEGDRHEDTSPTTSQETGTVIIQEPVITTSESLQKPEESPQVEKSPQIPPPNQQQQTLSTDVSTTTTTGVTSSSGKKKSPKQPRPKKPSKPRSSKVIETDIDEIDPEAQIVANSRKKKSVERREPSKRAKYTKPKKTTSSSSTNKLKLVEIPDSKYEKSLRQIGQSKVSDLLTLTSAFVAQGLKEGNTSIPVQGDVLQKRMKDSTKWTADQCHRLLIPVVYGKTSNPMEDSVFNQYFAKKPCLKHIMDRFTDSNLGQSYSQQPQLQQHQQQQQQQVPQQHSQEQTPANLELAAFGLWATNAVAGGEKDESSLYSKWVTLDGYIRDHFENLAVQEYRMREMFLSQKKSAVGQ